MISLGTISLVPLAGIKPALLAELDFESSASTNSATGLRPQAFGPASRRGPVNPTTSMKDPPRVDDDRLAGHGLGAAHGDHHVGAVVLVGGLLQQ